ncbi:patatin-like phospholipase family protein [Neolewinella antarctica]|uniref:NTE family protein n=1 Tax=Neolewinella antarctica TaxID=442734 RepID=A0ABX0X6Y5_9BACT|nr:patatin-like phospholipase family protein [Neolewinella antarctica]NJC24999.1 NTE family protein [Neolewinella antarctica]
MNKDNPIRIGLTLSGGGARGAAHVGVLRALLENDIVPNRIVGVSAGAIVGTLYAAGLDPDEMMKAVAATSLVKLVRFGIPTTGLTKLDYLAERILEVLPNDSFDDLRFPLHIGITNLNSGQLELRNSGSISDILAASCSIPFVFKPVLVDGNHCVDGGVICNMPVTPLLNDADFIIGSNLMPYGMLPPADTGTVINIVWRCFDLGIMSNTLPSLDLCDIVIEPSLLNSFNIFSINRLTELHDVGYEHTLSRIPAIKKTLALKKDLLRQL